MVEEEAYGDESLYPTVGGKLYRGEKNGLVNKISPSHNSSIRLRTREG
jgi:hypothetical protein